MAVAGFAQLSAQELPPMLAQLATPESSPNWIHLKDNANINKDQLLQLLKNGFGYPASDGFQVQSSKQDEIGYTHYLYMHYHEGFPVEGGDWVLHEDNEGRLYLANGRALTNLPNVVGTIPFLPHEEALQKTLETINADLYAWESSSHEKALKMVSQDDGATYFPEGELIWANANDGRPMRLAYQFDIYALKPLSRKFYYLDAFSGQLVRVTDQLTMGCFSDVNTHGHHGHSAHPSSFALTDQAATGLANYVTANGGEVDFTSHYDTTQYLLKATTLGPSNTQVIHTLNANNTGGAGLMLIDFTDPDNYWEGDTVGVGAHWGTEQVYDYFLQTHGRNSFDDAGSPLLSRVHYSLIAEGFPNNVNAFWDGTQMTYGDGDGINWGPLTSLDVIAHELAHGVTQFNGTGGLRYFNESGALNESFSDIFGAILEFERHPDGGDWTMGEDFDYANGNGFRNMANPHAEGHPKAYYGLNWYIGVFDNGGVHLNSGVQNYWFYLLTDGGSGTNEYSYIYNVTGIGLTDAAAIAYRNLTNYLLYESPYIDARNGSIQAAIDLFGNGSPQHLAVEEAWCACGVGVGCLPTITATSPILNEVLTAGQNYTITWTSTLLPPNSGIKIEYTTDTASSPVWLPVVDSIPNNGVYSWFVTNDYSETVRLKVSDQGDTTLPRPGNPLIFGISDTFEIVPCIADTSFSAPFAVGLGDTAHFTNLITGVSYQWTVDSVVIGMDSSLSYVFMDYGAHEVEFRVESASGCSNIETKTVYVLPENSNGFTLQFGEFDQNIHHYAQDVIITKDGNYVFASQSEVFKISPTGGVIWRSPGRPNLGFPNYKAVITEKEDGNILLVHTKDKNQSSTPYHNLSIIEIDGNSGMMIGNQGKEIETQGDLLPRQIITVGNGYIIGGDAVRNGQKDVFFIKLDTSLAITVQEWVGDTTKGDQYSQLIPTADGGYLLGFTQWAYPGYRYAAMVKYDSLFQRQWKQGIHSSYSGFTGISDQSRLRMVEIPECGGYMVLIAPGPWGDSYLFRTDFMGTPLWAKRYSTDDVSYPSIPTLEIVLFHEMVWDGIDGVTLLGLIVSDATITPGFGLINGFEYQLTNFDLDGNIRWKNKIPDLDVNFPHDQASLWYSNKIIRTSDGGYLSMIPSKYGYGSETLLQKTDRLGLDVCHTQPTTLEGENILHTFQIRNTFTDTILSPPSFNFVGEYSFMNYTPNLWVDTICPAFSLKEVVAAFIVNEQYVLQNDTVGICNLSRGAHTYFWEIDGSPVPYPFPPFATVGAHEIKLIATDGTDTSSVSQTIHVLPDPALPQVDFTATLLDGTGYYGFEANLMDPLFIYEWDFGDSSTLMGDSVKHNYFYDSTYQVGLMVTSCLDSSYYSEPILVDCTPDTPIVPDTMACAGSPATLEAQNPLPGEIYWYENLNDTVATDTGAVFSTPILPLGIYDYYAERKVPTDTFTIGLPTNTEPPFSHSRIGLAIKATSPFKFHSTELHVKLGGTLVVKIHEVIEDYHQSNEVYSYSTTVSPNSRIAIPINQVFPPGNYVIKLDDATSNATAYLNSTPGFDYPYEISGYPEVLQIVGMGTAPACCFQYLSTSHYPAFYNLKISLHESCISEREEVLVESVANFINDSCAAAIPLPVNGTSHTFSYSLCMDTSGIHPSCAPNNGPDAWFSFIAPSPGFIDLSIEGLPNFGFAIYSDCNTPLHCYTDNSGAQSVSFIIGDLQSGQPYYLQYWTDAANTGSFDIKLDHGCPSNMAFYGINIPSDIYQVTNNITSNGYVKDGEDVTFRAGFSIDLIAGFDVELNGEFLAVVEGCKATFPAGGNPVVGEPNKMQKPTDFAMSSHYDPLTSQLAVKYHLASPASPSISVLDKDGRQVNHVATDQQFPEGEYLLKWKLDGWPSGVYTIVFKTDKWQKVDKFVVLE